MDDSKQTMCGNGSLIYEANPEKTDKTAGELGYNSYSGTFFNDKFHGIGRQVWPDFTYEGEYKEGRRHGNCTVYFHNGEVYNMKYEEGKEVFRRQVTEPSKAWYGNGQEPSLPFQKHAAKSMSYLVCSWYGKWKYRNLHMKSQGTYAPMLRGGG